MLGLAAGEIILCPSILGKWVEIMIATGIEEEAASEVAGAAAVLVAEMMWKSSGKISDPNLQGRLEG